MYSGEKYLKYGGLILIAGFLLPEIAYSVPGVSGYQLVDMAGKLKLVGGLVAAFGLYKEFKSPV